MKTPVAFCIGNEAVSFFVLLSAIVHILTSCLREVIVIHEIITRVIWRVDINHLHFAQIVLAKKFQHLQVVAFNIEVLRIVKVYTLLTTRTQGICGRCIR